MIIRSLKIEGFGLYSDTGIEGLNGGLTVICAENGGGKTTFREFLRAMLFGFGRGASRYTPWMASPHRGILQIETRDGQSYRLQRNFARSQVELTNADGQPGPELSILLNSASLDLYKNVFAIGLSELQEAKLLDDEKVKAMIGGFGSAHGGKALMDANKNLKDELEVRFKPSGQKPLINALLQSVEGAQKDLNQAHSEAQKYWHYEEQLSELESQIQELTRSEEPLRQRRDHLLILEKAWPEWVQLRAYEDQLESVTPIVEKFPDRGVVRLEELISKLRDCDEELSRRQAEIEQDQQQFAALAGSDALLPHSNSLDELWAGWNSFDANGQALTKAAVETQRLNQDLTSGLKQLGNWTLEQLLAFELNLPANTKREAATRDLKAAVLCVQEVERQAVSIERVLTAKVAEEQTAKTALQNQSVPPSHSEIDSRIQKVNQARQKINEILRFKTEGVRLQVELGEAQRQVALFAPKKELATPVAEVTPEVVVTLNPPVRQRPTGLILAGFILLSGLLTAGLSINNPPVALTAGGLGIAGSGLAWWLLRESSAPSQFPVPTPVAESVNLQRREEQILLAKSHEHWQQKLAEIETKIQENAQSLKAVESALDVIAQAFNTLIPNLEHCDRIEEKLQSYREQRRQFEREEQGVLALERRAKELTIQHDGLQKDIQLANQALETATQHWQAWLQAQGLDLSLSPEVAELLCNEISNVRQLHGQWQNSQQNVNQLQNVRSIYWSKLSQFFDLINRSLPSGSSSENQSQAFRLLVDLKQERDEARNKSTQREITERGIKEKQREFELTQTRLQQLKLDYECLLQEGEARSPEEFRVRAEAAQLRRELKGQIRVQLGHLETLSGPGEPVRCLQTELAEQNLESLQSELETAKEQWQNYASQLAELSQLKGQRESARDHLANSEDVVICAEQLAQGKSELEEVADEWAVRKLALWLLNGARNKFEQERQPAVLQSASSCLSTISGGQFTKIAQTLESDKYQLMQANGGYKNDDQEWNTGLKEQAYWSLRLGLIEDYATRAEPLPLIIDDAFVNFDPQRLKGAIQCLNDISQRHQIFLLTCHRHTEALLREFAPDAQFFTVENGHFLPN
jgi:uncharacterized protein YhaN